MKAYVNFCGDARCHGGPDELGVRVRGRVVMVPVPHWLARRVARRLRMGRWPRILRRPVKGRAQWPEPDEPY